MYYLRLFRQKLKKGGYQGGKNYLISVIDTAGSISNLNSSANPMSYEQRLLGVKNTGPGGDV